MNQNPFYMSNGIPTGFGSPSYGPLSYAPAHYGFVNWNTAHLNTASPELELAIIQRKLDQALVQIAQLQDVIARAQLTSPGRYMSPGYVPAPYSTPFGQIGAFDLNHGRIRENDSYFFWEVPLPTLSLNDVEVEVSGTRVICRTRVPVPHAWSMTQPLAQAQMARGFEIFELPNGRIELSCQVPVLFHAAQVEATLRDGWLCISIPKAEASQRQVIKVGATSSATRKNSQHDLNA